MLKSLYENTFEMVLEGYFEMECGTVYTDSGIEICYNTDAEGKDASISLAMILREQKDEQGIVLLELICVHESVGDFVRTHKIKTTADISRISDKDLWRLYHEGKGRILCDVHDKLRIWFQKVGNKMTALDADNEQVPFPVLADLSTKDDYIQFCRNLTGV